MYVHYIIRQSVDYVYGLMTGLFTWISLAALLSDICLPLISKPTRVQGKLATLINLFKLISIGIY